jgi:outer membrane autotransporter protein
MEIINALRWQASKQLQIKTDCKLFSGGPYLLKNNYQQILTNGADVSVGAEFSINKNFSAWLDVNNLLNNKYERWHNYPVYGIHIIGGVMIKF